jgi:spermidine/putrescine transport system permease protein
MYVWGVAQRGVPMQVNVVGTVMFLISIAIVVGAELNRRRQEKALV